MPVRELIARLLYLMVVELVRSCYKIIPLSLRMLIRDNKHAEENETRWSGIILINDTACKRNFSFPAYHTEFRLIVHEFIHRVEELWHDNLR